MLDYVSRTTKINSFKDDLQRFDTDFEISHILNNQASALLYFYSCPCINIGKQKRLIIVKWYQNFITSTINYRHHHSHTFEHTTNDNYNK